MTALKISDLDVHKAIPPVPEYAPTFRTFYSPEDAVHDALKAVLLDAKKSVVVAMYGFDDDEFAKILDTHLKNPKMYVQISLDRSQAGGVHERQILDLYKHEMTGNSVAIGVSERGAIMHRKMVVVDGVWRISGSTNWSTSGESLQDNEATVLYDHVAAAEARAVMDLEHTAMLKQMAARAAKAAGTAA